MISLHGIVCATAVTSGCDDNYKSNYTPSYVTLFNETGTVSHVSNHTGRYAGQIL